MNIHLCIVTGQPLANLIPILQEKPARVALAISADMAAPAQRFVRTLESAGWSPDQIDQYPGVPSSDHDRIFEGFSYLPRRLNDDLYLCVHNWKSRNS